MHIILRLPVAMTIAHATFVVTWNLLCFKRLLIKWAIESHCKKNPNQSCVFLVKLILFSSCQSTITKWGECCQELKQRSQNLVYLWSSALAPLLAAPPSTLKQWRQFKWLYCCSSSLNDVIVMSLSCFIIICLCKLYVIIPPRIDAMMEEWCHWPLHHRLSVIQQKIDTKD